MRQAHLQRAQRRRFQRGQTLVIFALSATVLMGFAGLAIDVLRAYDLYAREQRAAEAGALAGVLYMPNYYTATYTDSNGDSYSAITRSLAEVQKNGFGVGSSPNSSCTGAVAATGVYTCMATGSQTALTVSISQPIDVFFLAMVGIGSFNVTATATAAYLPPLGLGSQDPNDVNTSYFGDGGTCANPNPEQCFSKFPPNRFMAAISGPAELKEEGDPLVYCQQGSSYQNSLDVPALPTGPLTEASTGFATNHISTPTSCGNGNKDAQGSQWNGAFATSKSHAYDYGITTSGTPFSLWVFNPNPVPNTTSGTSCSGLTQVDGFYTTYDCSAYYPHFGSIPGGATPNFKDPRLYFTAGYSLYQMPVAYGSGSGTLVPGATFQGMPYDGMAGNGCGNNQVLPILSTGPGPSCVSNSVQNYWQKIADVGNPPAGTTTYRLAVDAAPLVTDEACGTVCGWGYHSYGVAVCPIGATPPCQSNPPAGVSVNPWNIMDIYLTFANSNTANVIPLISLDKSFAGRTLTVSIFDPGDSHANGDNSWFAVVPPVKNDAGATNPAFTEKFQNWVVPRTSATTNNGVCPTNPNTQYCPPSGQAWWVQSAAQLGPGVPSDNVLNGLWTQITVKIPSGYLGGQWWYTEFSNQGNGFDQMAIELSINGGSPIHLIG